MVNCVVEENISRANGRRKGRERRGPGGTGEKIYPRCVTFIYTCIKQHQITQFNQLIITSQQRRLFPKKSLTEKVQLSVQTDVTEISP